MNDNHYDPAAPGGAPIVIDGREYRPSALLHQGRDSRIFSAASTSGREDSAFVIKQYLCRPGDETWQTAMRDIEAAQLMKRCRHTVTLLGTGIHRWENGDCEIQLLMERLLPCETFFSQDKAADEASVAALCRDIAKALRAMHRKGLTHGDVKPANLYYREGTGWLLGDFGSVTRRGELPRFVSEGYCSPEARRGAPCGLESDLYSLGVTAYKLLSGGRLPFCEKPCRQMPDDEVYRAIERRLSGETIPPLPHVSRSTNQMVLGLMRQRLPRHGVMAQKKGN
jgi:serine/threonine protein kinase